MTLDSLVVIVVVGHLYEFLKEYSCFTSIVPISAVEQSMNTFQFSLV